VRHRRLPVVEDAHQIATYDDAVCQFTQRSEWQRVVDVVSHTGPARNRGELVAVVPEPVGATDLPIDEPPVLRELVDPGDPAQRDPVHTQAILNPRSDGDLRGLWRQQPRS
jgi:hypothetical protein